MGGALPGADADATVVMRPGRAPPSAPLDAVLAAAPHLAPLVGADARRSIGAIVAHLDARLDALLHAILHHPDFQALEASWRALELLLAETETGPALKIRVLDVSRRDLARSLRKFRGTAWDDSPLFRRVYEEEYGRLGGEPFGLLLADYSFDHAAEDTGLLADLARIAAAAHAPLVAAAAPSLLGLEDWAAMADRHDIARVFALPEYAAWRSLRESEDARYLALCLPRFLLRLPYGHRTDPVARLDHEERASGPDRRHFLWANASWLFALVVARAFARYGWCVRINGIAGGGLIDELPPFSFDTADGATDRRPVAELAISERREAELARLGLITLVHVKGSNAAAFISAPSLQQPARYDDPAATANAAMSARLPYLFVCCRFAHYIKCMVRDKSGGTMGRQQLEAWLGRWLQDHVDGNPATSDEEWRARRPLAEAALTIEPRPDDPGHYQANFFVRPHFQLEGATAALRLVTRVGAN